MTARWRATAAAGALAAVALTACTSVDPAIREAEPLACGDSNCATFDAPIAIGPGSALEVDAGDLFFDPEELTATEGDLEVTMVNVGAGLHNFTIEGDQEPVAEAPGGEEATGTKNLFAGEYVYFCSIPGHRAGGMEGTLVVYAEGEAPTSSEAPQGEGASPDPSETGTIASPDSETTESPTESES